MTTRYDVLASRKEKDGKWRSLKIGVAFPKDDGRFDIILEAAPFAGPDGTARLALFPAREKDGERKPASGANNATADLDDKIPF